MKLFYYSILCALLTLCLNSRAEEQLAFPGAEGFGRFTTGGRGGTVYHVTNLNDKGAGSFREACEKSGKRTIVFDVSGTIHLKSELKLRKANVTIAGQTAPGEGICIADYPFVIAAKNVIIRYVRFRLGNEALKKNSNAHEGDGLGGMDTENVIVDHCSVSWSIDECLSVYGSKNITIQWCIAAQSLVNAGHSKGAHGYGGNWGGSGASYHHNLLAHHTSRMPRLGPRPGTQTDERMDLRNNVFYNWAGEGCYGGEGMNVNIVNNYYEPGPATFERNANIQKRIAGIGIRTTEYTKHGTSSANDWDVMWHKWGTFYVKGNYNSSFPSMDEWKDGVLNQINKSKCDNYFNDSIATHIHRPDPIDFPNTTTHTAPLAFEQVLSYAGASLFRDAVDSLVVSDSRLGIASRTGKGLSKGFINSQDDLKPADAPADWSAWPTLKSLPAPADSDGDGIPDDWEIANGLNPSDASDGKSVADDGFTYLEHYLNGLVEHITTAQNKGGSLEHFTASEKSNAVRPVRSDKASSTPIDLTGRPVRDINSYRGLYIVGGRLKMRK
ncbi:MAG: pectate lyase [Bacteroidales bacterium]|nr:pectate lyase [Bacteroidales bacterium]